MLDVVSEVVDDLERLAGLAKEVAEEDACLHSDLHVLAMPSCQLLPFDSYPLRHVQYR